jgi:SPP1 gp7 family putative phage head morphogenesis protein
MKDWQLKLNLCKQEELVLQRKRNKTALILVSAMRDLDPTRSITLRNRFVVDMTGRFRALRSSIIRSVADNDCFGLKAPRMVIMQDIPPEQFMYRTSAEKIAAFDLWLQEMVNKGILEVSYNPTQGSYGSWTNTYVLSAYQKGLIMARNDLKAIAGITIGSYTAQELATTLNAPFTIDRLGLIYTRVFSDLEGVTETMSTQISRTLAQALVEGVNPYETARRIVDRVDGIGITRANSIARTETIRALNSAALNEFAAAERVIGEEILVQWWTARDERVCAICAPRHGKIYTRDEAQKIMTPHPECRCALLPYIKSEKEV